MGWDGAVTKGTGTHNAKPTLKLAKVRRHKHNGNIISLYISFSHALAAAVHTASAAGRGVVSLRKPLLESPSYGCSKKVMMADDKWDRTEKRRGATASTYVDTPRSTETRTAGDLA